MMLPPSRHMAPAAGGGGLGFDTLGTHTPVHATSGFLLLLVHLAHLYPAAQSIGLMLPPCRQVAGFLGTHVPAQPGGSGALTFAALQPGVQSGPLLLQSHWVLLSLHGTTSKSRMPK